MVASHAHHQGEWWLILHVLQLPLFSLVALALFLLLSNIHNVAAAISRVALAVFAIFYTAFDAIAGIATGILFRKVRSMNLPEGDPMLDRLFEVFIAIFNLDMPFGNLIIQLAVWSWVAAGIAAAVALYMKGYNRAGVMLIGIASLTFQSHAYPYGPITMLLILAGIICIEFFPKSLTEVK
jgi:uncharacterized membrane protein YGL010W